MLRRLVAEGQKFNTEIARLIGKRPASVSWRVRKLGLTPSRRRACADRMGGWNAKHAELRGPAMKYFMTHSWEETRKKFGLTESELKSVFTVGYRMPEFKHLRKETRDHSAWTAKQLQFLLTHAGLRPRKWILSQLGRGKNVCTISERLQALGLSSRTLQGLTLSQFREAFGQEPAFFLQTDAGPDGGLKTSLPTRWKIIPWVWLDQELKAKRLKTAKELRMLIAARAQFQEWIFGGNALRKMKRIVRDEQLPLPEAAVAADGGETPRSGSGGEVPA
jgi:hypothetical protein